MSEDLISREKAYEVLSEYYHQRTEIQHKALREALDMVPSAEPSPENCWGCNCPKMVPPAELQPTCNKLATSCNQLATDCISRQAAIDAMEQAKEQYFDRRVIIGKMQDIVNNLPSVDIDLSDYSDRLWRNAYEQGKAVSKDALDEAYAHGYTAAEADFHKQNQWIPCDKGEPDEDMECWITVKTTDALYRGNFTKRYGERRDKGFITSGGFMWWNTAIAWMPIYEPEPWKGGAE